MSVPKVRDFQAVIGKEVRHQCLEKMGGDPDILLACVGGGSNAIGLFHEFVDDAHVRLIGAAAHPFKLCLDVCMQLRSEFSNKLHTLSSCVRRNVVSEC